MHQNPRVVESHEIYKLYLQNLLRHKQSEMILTPPFSTFTWNLITTNWSFIVDHHILSNKITRTLLQASGILESNMQSRASLSLSDMMMVPSIANLRSCKVLLTAAMTFCIRSNSCLRNITSGLSRPILRRLSFTCQNELVILRA